MDKPVPRCLSCNHLDDVSDGPEYGPPWYVCTKKPHMSNLRGFPFKSELKCYEIHWTHLVDWKAEAAKEGQIISEGHSQ